VPGSSLLKKVGQLVAPAEVPAERFRHVDGHACFEIYRTERVSLTSIMFSGDDWRWRLRSAAGAVVVNSQGYSSERACEAAVAALQKDAGSAVIAERERD
jgi:uncharacterized protein YegP (UPF0339 family)